MVARLNEAAVGGFSTSNARNEQRVVTFGAVQVEPVKRRIRAMTNSTSVDVDGAVMLVVFV